MNHQNWSKRKFWIVVGSLAVFSWVVGVGMGGSSQPVNTVVKDREVVKEVKVENTERFDKLRAIDEEIFETNRVVIEAQNKVIMSVGGVLTQYPYINPTSVNNAADLVNEQSGVIKTQTSEMNKLIERRNEVVGK